jgi:hypothetical protein
MRPPRRESLDPTNGIRRSKQCALRDHELFVGDDWAQDHHDVELMDEAGQTLAKARLPEGVAGITRLHNMIGAQLGEDADEAEVAVALVAAGYTVYAVNPPRRRGIGNATACPAPRAMRRMHTPWPTWSAPMRTSCGQWRPTARWLKRSKWLLERIRR